MDCFPRFFLVGAVRFFADTRSLFDALAKAEKESIRSTVFLEEPFQGAVEANESTTQDSSIRLVRYSPDRIILALEIRRPCVLVASNSYSPYWKCRIDGQPRDVFPAYGTFWGVQVYPTEKTLEFIYEPPYVDGSGWLAPRLVVSRRRVTLKNKSSNAGMAAASRTSAALVLPSVVSAQADPAFGIGHGDRRAVVEMRAAAFPEPLGADPRVQVAPDQSGNGGEEELGNRFRARQ
jgi:hypothetical protein